MKNSPLIFMTVALVLIFSWMSYASCHSSKETKFTKKTDTVFVLYRSPEGLNYRRGVYTTEKARVFEDSVSLVAKIGLDTLWVLEVPNFKDTVKDLKGKPLYDSAAHQYRFNNQWYKLTPLENKTVKIQIVTI